MATPSRRQSAIAIRPATRADAALLPGIERCADAAFRAVPGLEWIADAAPLPADAHLGRINAGTVWIAAAPQGRPVGFLSAERTGDTLHLWQMAVLPSHQRAGYGRALLRRAIDHAKANRLCAITLTTFCDLPFNAPFYRALGFTALGLQELDARLVGILEEEQRHGLPGERRCAMRLALTP